MLSPDGKWVWDGTQWRPIAHHETLFPSWQSITVEPAAPVAEAVQAPVRVAAPAPALIQPVDLSLAYPSMPESAPAWRRKEPKATGVNYYLYFIGGVVGIVIILVVLNSVFPLWLLLPGPKASNPPAAAQASPPPPVAHRSDFARADYFVSGVLPPALADLNHVLQPVGLSCSRALTVSCQNALDAAVPKLQGILPVFDKNPVPLCVAVPVARVRADLVGINNAVQAAEKAYADNQAQELAAAMSAYSAFDAVFARDVPAVTTAMNANCDPTVVGP
jgi:hypothetical protein